jgi:hypothetical protein
MSWNFAKLFGRDKSRMRQFEDAASLISQWEIVAEPDCIRIRPVGEELTPAAMTMMVEKIIGLNRPDGPFRIVFDFSQVQRFGPGWTPIVAGLVQVARRLPEICEIVGLHGQPEAAVRLYRTNKTLMGMIPRRSAA